MTTLMQEFTLRKPPFCGLDCEEYLAWAIGKEYPHPKKGIPLPTLPSTMYKRMLGMGFTPVRKDVALNERVSFLEERLVDKCPVAIWVRSKASVSFCVHVVVVTGYDGRNFYVMDDRVGKTSHDPQFPSGNVYWTEEDLLSVWKHPPWSTTAPAVYLVF